MKIVFKTTYREGGTWLVRTDKGIEYCKDYRMGSDPNNPGYATHLPTVGRWFLGYPNDDNSNIIEDTKLIVEIENAFNISIG